MNKKILETLEFEKIKADLNDNLFTEKGKELLLKENPSNDKKIVEENIDLTDEMVSQINNYKPILFLSLNSISEANKRLNKNANINESELINILNNLKMFKNMSSFYKNIKSTEFRFKNLDSLAKKIIDLEFLYNELKLIINEDGKILDSASPELKSNRIKQEKNEISLQKTISSEISKIKNEALENKNYTFRYGKVVLPIKSEYRKSVRGSIVDKSQSGQTLFIQPDSIASIQEESDLLKIEESNIIQNILSNVSNRLREYTREMEENQKIVSIFDLINSKAKYSISINGTKPYLSDNELKLTDAWHPLLNTKKIVKNDFLLNDDLKSLIITGSNTGGKTVAIKTVGIISLMAQFGLYIPSKEGSTVIVFDNIFADIGDNQSLSENLSTFSSHLKNVLSFLGEIDDKTLILLDELGSGTDPNEGSALAISILSFILEKNAFSITTSHYPELKIFADENSFAKNASMIFDVENLKPTYKMEIGISGQSNGLKIAERIGFPKEIVDNANNFIDEDKKNLNDLIQETISKKLSLEKDIDIYERKKRETELLQKKLEADRETFNNNRDEILSNAKISANKIINNTKKDIKKIVKGLKSSREDILNRQTQASDSLNKLTFDTSIEDNKILKKALKNKDLKAGDQVFVPKYSQFGEILSKKGNSWEVQIGILKLTLNDDELEKDQSKKPKETHKTNLKVTKKINTKKISSKLDIRGQRYDEALINLDKFLDESVMSNFSVVEIIHGKGSGVLRKVVQEELQGDRRVKSFNLQNDNEGGDGATVVKLK